MRNFGPTPVPFRAHCVMSSSREKLPKGFARRASGALRVQIRAAGFSEVRNFPLLADTVAERRRQMAEAEAWASETRRRIVGGSHVSTREAERTSFASVLERYGREGLTGDAANANKDRDRIAIILRDPIARKMLAQLRKTDVAAFRDRLIEAGFLRSAERIARRLQRLESGASDRIADVLSLRELTGEVRSAAPDLRPMLQTRIAEIASREGVKRPARSTIGNILQLVNRSLKYAAQTIEGVPNLSGIPLPPSSHGRDRRVGDDELAALSVAAGDDRLLPLILKFAVATTLRRERLLTCRTSHFCLIGENRFAIVFPKSSSKRKKRTGVVPLTREPQKIVREALSLQGFKSVESAPDVALFPITLAAFESRWKRLLISSGVENLHFHDMRHEGTSRLFERGLTTAEVMSITGHSTQEMVDRYSHYSAALVLKKLEKGQEEAALAEEIGFLCRQYSALGGDVSRIQAILTSVAEQGSIL